VGNQPNVGQTPGQVAVSLDGRWLAVSVKNAAAKGWFELFELDRRGRPAADPTITPSNDPQPFGFGFDTRGTLVTSQAAGSAASSYRVGADGALTPVTADVANGRKAACWLALTGHFAYTTTISA